MLKVNGGGLMMTVACRIFGGNSVAGIYGLGVTANPATFTRASGSLLNFAAGQHTVSGVTDRASVPAGARHPVAWVPARKAGGLASSQEAIGLGTATLSLISGRNMAGQSDGSATVLAALQLVVSMLGSAAGLGSATGNLLAVLWGAGVSAGISAAEALIQAIAWCYGTAAGDGSASLVAYATGQLQGTIYVNQSEATVNQIVDGVWKAVTEDHDDAGTMGEALGAAGTAGDPWTTSLPGTYSGSQAGAIIALAAKILRNKTITDPANGVMTVYEDDGVTELLSADLFEDAEGAQAYRGQGAERRERLE